MSLKVRLILGFLIVSIIPVTAVILFGYYNSSNLIRTNTEVIAQNQIRQTGTTLDVWMGSYEDILFQIYTNDEIVALIDTINRNDADYTVASGQLRRTLRGMFYTKEHIKSITVITESGAVVFYDMLTGFATKNAWLDTLGTSKEGLYEYLSADNFTHMIPTKYAGIYANEKQYLFHLGHRIIDYKNVDRKLGVVVVSIDEKLLGEICGYEGGTGEFTFLTDTDGRLISFPEREMLGQNIITWSDDEAERQAQYAEFIRSHNLISGRHIAIKSAFHEFFGFDIVHVSDQSQMVRLLENQRNVMLLISVLSTILLILIIIILTHSLTASLQILVEKMRQAEKGELSVRMDTNIKMLPEVYTIATRFNHMLDKISDLLSREKIALEKQKNAEIEALEAQINPHFLYNTLDTINWMAIDKEQYEISNSLTSLATILRYGIDKSNSIVTVRKECEWLKQYLFLQQKRFKNQFSYGLHVDSHVLEWKVHKLLLQPFVENSILHGFEGKSGRKELNITIQPVEEVLQIEIYDNGKGIEQELVQQMNAGIFPPSKERNHIGMENAITRIYMYYQEEALVCIESETGSYTKIVIQIPMRVD